MAHVDRMFLQTRFSHRNNIRSVLFLVQIKKVYTNMRLSLFNILILLETEFKRGSKASPASPLYHCILLHPPFLIEPGQSCLLMSFSGDRIVWMETLYVLLRRIGNDLVSCYLQWYIFCVLGFCFPDPFWYTRCFCTY